MKFGTGSKYFLSFLAGILFTVVGYGVFSVLSFLSVGREIQSKSSYPPYHSARLYSRPGPGDQNYSLVVDGNWVYQSPDAPSGDQREEIRWDDSGKVVIFISGGEVMFKYDAANQKEIKE